MIYQVWRTRTLYEDKLDSDVFIAFVCLPECLKEVRSRLGQRVLHYGPLPRDEYWRVLQQADIAVSTARHEFFGVAMSVLHCTYRTVDIAR